jgi:hypothetical protein
MQESTAGCEAMCACQLRKARFNGNKIAVIARCSLPRQALRMTPTAACLQHATAVATAPAVKPHQTRCKEREKCRSKKTQPDGTASSQPLQGCCCAHLTAVNKGGFAATWLPAQLYAQILNHYKRGQQTVASCRPRHGLFPPSKEFLA